jgi:hypothetical protein
MNRLDFVLLVLCATFFAGCKKSNELPSSKPEPQPKLAGTWKYEHDLEDGRTWWSTVVVGADGSYVCDATNFGPNYFKKIHIEGKWEIKDRFLIDTITNYSNTNAPLPSISTNQIVRFSTNELVIRYRQGGTNYFEAGFQKQNGD